MWFFVQRNNKQRIFEMLRVRQLASLMNSLPLTQSQPVGSCQPHFVVLSACRFILLNRQVCTATIETDFLPLENEWLIY